VASVTVGVDGTECIVVDPDSDSIESLNFSISGGSESLSDYEIASLSDFDINEEASDSGSEDPSFDLDSSFESDSDADISDWSTNENAEEPRISSGDTDIAGPKPHEHENVFTTPLYKGLHI